MKKSLRKLLPLLVAASFGTAWNGDFDADSQTAEAMLEAIAVRSWDIALSDYVLPRFSGMDALRIWRQSGFDAPFIVTDLAFPDWLETAGLFAGLMCRKCT